MSSSDGMAGLGSEDGAVLAGEGNVAAPPFKSIHSERIPSLPRGRFE